MVRRALVFLFLVACGDDAETGPDAAVLPDAPIGPDAPAVCADAGPLAPTDCSAGGCDEIPIPGDTPLGVGSFHGYADPSVRRDPTVAGRVWLAYSWPHLVAGTDPGGNPVIMAAVSTHLARSDNDGASFAFAGELWPEEPVADPEGTGQNGLLSSETASLTWLQSGSETTWYGAHLVYFLEPKNGYHPRYATGWTVRIGAAASPAALGDAPEAVLGVSATASVYHPDVRLDTLAGLDIARCAMLNNPTLFAQDGTLYLIVECLAFAGTTLDNENSTTQVFATTPEGVPSTWVWRHAGKLADVSLARQLGDDTIQQPDVSLAADGTLLALFTPASDEDPGQVGTVGDGCRAVELVSIDPPALARDCAGRAIVRASVVGTGLGACTHDASSASGIIVTSSGSDGWRIHATRVRP